jgi:hypothetical protein
MRRETICLTVLALLLLTLMPAAPAYAQSAPARPKLPASEPLRQGMTAIRDIVLCAAFSPDGRLAAPALILSGHTRAVMSAAFSPGGGLALTASFDGTAKVWHIPAE